MADYDVPTLEVGFAIETGASFDELTRLQQVMESTEGKVLAEATKIERATGGMVKLGGATSQITTFGNAASRELANVARDTNRAEKAGESMVRQLERQIEVFGKSATEIRQMRAEMRAVAAESQGLTELAARVRAASAEIDRLEASTGRLGKSRGTLTQLSFQMNDVATMAMSGSAPMQIFATQIGQIIQVAQMAEGGVKGFAMQLGGLALAAAPWIAAAAAAVAAVALITSEIDKNTAVNVTWKDTVLGAWDAAKAYLTGALTNAFAAFGVTTSDVWKDVVNITKWGLNWIIGAGTLGPRALIAGFQTIPAAIGDAFYSGVNIAIRAINWLVEKGVDAINAFARTVNAVLPEAFQLPTIAVPKISEVQNAYAGAGRTAGKALIGAITDTVNRDFIGEAASFLKPYAIARAKARAAEDGKDVGKALGKGLKDGVDAASDWLADARLDAWVNAQKMAADIAEKNLKWKLEGKTVGEQILEQDKAAQDAAEERQKTERETLEIYLQQLSTLEQMGGTIGDIAGIVNGLYTGNFSGVGGNLGKLLNSASTVIGKDGWKEVTGKLDSLFGSSGDGSFARTVSSGLGAFSFAVEANKMIGNIFGFKGGPLGIFTSLFDSIINPSRSAGATLTGGSGYTIGGKDKKQYGVAEGLGDSVLGGLSQIASALGVKVGSFNTTIGIRDGDYRVNTDGTSLKLKNGAVDFGEDADAAIKYAIADAIKDGALMGLRASTQALLKAGDDIEAQLQKALQFESVFTELKAMTDPVGAAIDTLDKQFAKLRAVFAEAGASAAEYADLEQLYQLKKVEAIKQANSAAEELSRDRRTLEARILELQGKDLQSVAMLRQVEIEQMDASLRPLQQRVWAMEDATAIIEKMQPLVDSLQAYRDTLFGQDDGALSYRTALIKLMQTGGLAAGGDATALANLQGVSQDFLTSARNNASSMAQYQRDVAMVARYVDGGIDAAQNQIDVAQATLDATNASVLLLTSIDDTLSAAADAAAISTSSATGSAGSMADLGAKIDALKAELEQMRNENNAGHAATAGNTGAVKRHLDNVTAQSGGDAISTVPAA